MCKHHSRQRPTAIMTRYGIHTCAWVRNENPDRWSAVEETVKLCFNSDRIQPEIGITAFLLNKGRKHELCLIKKCSYEKSHPIFEWDFYFEYFYIF